MPVCSRGSHASCSPITSDARSYCGTKKGRFVVWRKTAGKRMRAKLQQLKQTLRRRMHKPLTQLGEWLGVVVRGYYNYHAVPGNSASLGRFRDRLFWLRWKIVGRRSERRMRWDRYRSLFSCWVPYPRILHPYPHVRFDVRIQGKSRMR